MRQFMDRRLTVVAGCLLVLAAGPGSVRGGDFFGRCEVVSGPKSAADVDAPPAYVASRPAAVAPAPAPVPPAIRPAGPTVVYAWGSAEPQVTSQARQAISYYGGVSALATLSEMPQRPPIVASAPPPQRSRSSKPFQVISEDPTVSPYMNYYRDEVSSELALDYFTLVRPQIDQIETNRRQVQTMQQMRRQARIASPAVAGPQIPSAGAPGTGHVAHFMDTAQFYGNWRR